MTSLYALREEQGWSGLFTREQAPGAYPNGTRVQKRIDNHIDEQPAGATGTIIGSLSDSRIECGRPIYFVAWDAAPKHIVAAMHCMLTFSPSEDGP